MNNATKWAAIVTSPLMLSACGSGPGWLGSNDLTSGEPRISDAVWFQTQDVHVDPQGSEIGRKAYFEDDQYLPAMCLTPASRSLTRGNYEYVSQNPDLAPCIAQMKILIDRRFEHWIDSFNAWNSGANTILDNMVIGAGIAGTAAGGLTSRVMNAISASLTGVKTTVNNDFFYQKSVQIIITQMQTDRAKWDTIIQGRLQATQKTGMQCSPPMQPPIVRAQPKSAHKPVSSSSETVTENEIANTTTTVSATTTQKPPSNPVLPYCNLSEAWSDLEVYARQGSFNSALSTLSNNVSAQSAACQADLLNVKQADTTKVSGSRAGTSTATATSPCPTPATPTTNPAKKP